MSTLPTITLITPSFNQAHFLESTVESVLSQEYPKLEYWVIDGGSTDDSVKVLQRLSNKYPKRFQWVSEPDRGQTHALNKGLQLTKGDIVGYLNSDDVLLPGALQTVGQYFNEHADVQWVTGECEIIDEHGKSIQNLVQLYKHCWRSVNSALVLAILNPIAQPSTFWRRSSQEKVGLFDESLRYCMDYDFWFRLYQHSKPAILSQVLSQFRVHATSKGGASFVQQFREEIRVAERYQKAPVMQWLHRFHAWATVQAYQYLKA